MNGLNLIGQRYGKLTVTGKAESRGKGRGVAWSTTCDCGNTRIVEARTLRAGTVTSCGCDNKYFNHRVGIAGRRYGDLVVLSLDHVAGTQRYWQCRCSCGRELVVSTHDLVRGVRQACETCTKSKAVTEGYAAGSRKKRTTLRTNADHAVDRIKRDIRYRKKELALTDQQILDLIQQPCYYCGVSGLTVTNVLRSSDPFYHNGLDRLDSSVGYTTENVVPCCKDCNMAKGTKSVEEFLGHILRVARNMRFKSTAF